MRAIGTVVEEESGRPIAGLRVRAFDKDILFDDKLGVAVTDAKGGFRIDYSQLDFSSIFGTETSPRTLHSHLRRHRQEVAVHVGEIDPQERESRRAIRHQDSAGQAGLAIPSRDLPRR